MSSKNYHRCDFNTIPCDYAPTMLLIVTCLKGHVREKHLCSYHHNIYKDYLIRSELNCTICYNRMFNEYLEKKLS